MKTYDLYGTELSIYEVAEILELSLNLKLQERESSYLGVYLTTDYLAIEQFKIRKNWDPIDREAAELQYAQYTTLLYLSGTDRSIIVKESLDTYAQGKFILLKSEIF